MKASGVVFVVLSEVVNSAAVGVTTATVVTVVVSASLVVVIAVTTKMIVCVEVGNICCTGSWSVVYCDSIIICL